MARGINIGNITVGNDRVNVGNISVRSGNRTANTSIPLIKGEKGDTGPQGPQGEPGTTDYLDLDNKPSINDVTLVNNKNLEDLNVTYLTNMEIEQIINSVV